MEKICQLIFLPTETFSNLQVFPNHVLGGNWDGSLIIFDYELDMEVPNTSRARNLFRNMRLTGLERVTIYTKMLVNPLLHILFFSISQLIFHAIVIFEADGWYFSVEKNAVGLVVQRSSNFSDVSQRLCGERRDGYGEPQHWKQFDSPVGNCSVQGGVTYQS